jgi:hypothetical protein
VRAVTLSATVGIAWVVMEFLGDSLHILQGHGPILIPVEVASMMVVFFSQLRRRSGGDS